MSRRLWGHCRGTAASELELMVAPVAVTANITGVEA